MSHLNIAFDRFASIGTVMHYILVISLWFSHRCNLEVEALVQSHGDGHLSLVIPESVLSQYNEDMILIFFVILLQEIS